jgi:DNA-binding MarR family transcriptional regulator
MQDERERGQLSNGLVRLFRLINRVHNRKVRDTGVSAEQAHILLMLHVEGPMTIGQLGKKLALSSGTLTGAIDRLEAQELVRRAPSPDDGRAFVLESRLPARKRAQIERLVDDGERQCFAALTPTERAELLRLVEKCIAGLEPAT